MGEEVASYEILDEMKEDDLKLLKTLLTFEKVPDMSLLRRVTGYSDEKISSILEMFEQKGDLYKIMTVEGKYELNNDFYSKYGKVVEDSDIQEFHINIVKALKEENEENNMNEIALHYLRGFNPEIKEKSIIKDAIDYCLRAAQDLETYRGEAAIKFYEGVLEMNKHLEDPDYIREEHRIEIHDILLTLAELHTKLYSDKKKALDYCAKTKRLGEEIEDYGIITKSLWVTGMVALHSLPEEAKKYFEEALDTLDKWDLEPKDRNMFEAQLTQNIGVAITETENGTFDDAEKNYLKALVAYRDYNENDNVAQLLRDLIPTHSALGKHDLVMEHLEELENISPKNLYNKAEIQYNRGNYYYDIGEYIKAINAFQSALEIIEGTDYPEVECMSINYLVESKLLNFVSGAKIPKLEELIYDLEPLLEKAEWLGDIIIKQDNEVLSSLNRVKLISELIQTKAVNNDLLEKTLEHSNSFQEGLLYFDIGYVFDNFLESPFASQYYKKAENSFEKKNALGWIERIMSQKK